VKSRPRRASPKPPISDTVERRFQKRPASVCVPVSTLKPCSSQKPARRPPPRSSAPRTPRRLELMPPLASELTESPPFFTWRRLASTMPNSVTAVDCACAEVAAAAASARTMNGFFMRASLWRGLNRPGGCRGGVLAD
jgi:hypothetical protein